MGWLDFLDPIGTVVGGIVNGVSNIVSTHETNEANKDINESQLAAQRSIGINSNKIGCNKDDGL